MKNQGVKRGVTNEKIFSFLLDMDERITNIDEQLVEIRQTMATKDDLENTRQDILEEVRQELRPLHRAIDKDAKTIIAHGRRITTLEKRVGVPTR